MFIFCHCANLMKKVDGLCDDRSVALQVACAVFIADPDDEV